VAQRRKSAGLFVVQRLRYDIGGDRMPEGQRGQPADRIGGDLGGLSSWLSHYALRVTAREQLTGVARAAATPARATWSAR
jgi:hypothetical protein